MVPAALYFAINFDDPSALQGWAIPTATHIAFTLSVLALLGDWVPSGLKVFLLSLAVIDDLCAILVIAFIYTSSLGITSLIVATIMICLLYLLYLLYLLNPLHITYLVPYLFVGVILWASVLKSGIHATLAGVVLALFIPYENRPDLDVNLVKEIEHDLHGSV